MHRYLNREPSSNPIHSKNLSELPKLYDKEYFDQTGKRDSSAINESDDPLRFKKYIHALLERSGKTKPSMALDIGCAKGLVVRNLQEMNIKAIGVDVSRFALKNSVEGTGGVLVQAASEALPFPDNTFDLVTILDVVEHLEKPILALQEIHRILRLGGNGLITTLSSRHPSADKDSTHINVQELPYWLEGCRKAGLQVKREHIDIYDLDSVSSIPPGTLGRLMPKKLRNKLLLRSMTKRMDELKEETYFLFISKE